MESYFQKYRYTPSSEEIDKQFSKIQSNISHWLTPNVLTESLGFIDLTTLRAEDTVPQIEKMVNKVNEFNHHFPDYPTPASICVYPNFCKTIKDNLTAMGVGITAVAGGFPASQSFIEVKCLESKMAVEEGATEIDIVIALNRFFIGDYKSCSDEIKKIRKTIPSALLKVILETGLLVTPERIAAASFIAMEAGCDFIKTSTGKIEPAATPAAAIVMCECIKAYHQKTGKKIGFKPAGGIASARDVASYYGIVDTILGKEWLTPSLFRFGASRVANNILTELKKNTVSYY